MIQRQYPIAGSRGRSQKLLQIYIWQIGVDPLAIPCILINRITRFRVLSRTFTLGARPGTRYRLAVL
jgi:hypothetical protein